MKQRTTSFLVLFFLFSQVSLGEEKKTAPVTPVKKEVTAAESKKAESLELEPEKLETQFLNALDYPELQVVPRASERLQMDGSVESRDGYMMFWPFLAASGTTMVIALMHKNHFKPGSENDESFRANADFKVNAAAGLSAAWFAATYFISASEPYNSALYKINQVKGRDKKSMLLRERLAEEAMQKPADLVRMLAYGSTITNFIAAAGLLDTVNSDYNLYAGVAMLTSFLPLIFKNKYQENYEKHLEYKRKIYAPVVFTDLYKANAYAEWKPRLVFQWDY